MESYIVKKLILTLKYTNCFGEWIVFFLKNKIILQQVLCKYSKCPTILTVEKQHKDGYGWKLQMCSKLLNSQKRYSKPSGERKMGKKSHYSLKIMM